MEIHKKELENRENLGDVMSNFDHEIDEDIAKKLYNGKTFATYPAWNFHGTVWYEKKSKKFNCAIMQYHELVNTLKKDSLQEVMETASDLYGEK